ncbi:hypothetical protein [Tenacibaculum singaporense]|nr:hypothetical protein [Tenacibaculum singaporense]
MKDKQHLLPVITKYITYAKNDSYLEIPQEIRNVPECMSNSHKEIIRL